MLSGRQILSSDRRPYQMAIFTGTWVKGIATSGSL
jgi:hypothetical protein